MKNNLLRRAFAWLGGCVLAGGGLATPAYAQFSTSAAAPLVVCGAPSDQTSVQAFADGAGGAFAVWIDERGRQTAGVGAALYAQHLSEAGVAQLATNGKSLLQTHGKEIYGMRAVAWQGGLLVAWAQGRYGVGIDSVRCQYYNAAGVPQWAAPTVVASTTTAVSNERVTGLNVIPNDFGATITHGLTTNLLQDRFSFNRIDFKGKLLFPNNSFIIDLAGLTTYETTSDGGNGFFVVASSGGAGTQLYAQHFTLAGASWATGTSLTATGAGGHGDSPWHPTSDPAGNLYVTWSSDKGVVYVAQVTAAGALGWPAPGYQRVSALAGEQFWPNLLWHNNALWVVWNDTRDNTQLRSSNTYMQQYSAAGTRAWATNGVLINNLVVPSTYSQLAAADNGAVMAFLVTGASDDDHGFRVQKVTPAGSVVFPVAALPVATQGNNMPNATDYALVSEPNGSVQAYWGTFPTADGADIEAARVQRTGTLLGTEQAAARLGFAAYPNPATAVLTLRWPAGVVPEGLVQLFDGRGALVRAAGAGSGQLSLRGLPPGLYVLRATLAGQVVSCRVVVAAE